MECKVKWVDRYHQEHVCGREKGHKGNHHCRYCSAEKRRYTPQRRYEKGLVISHQTLFGD